MKYLGFDLGASSGKMMEGKLENGILKTKVVHRFLNRQIDICGGLYWDIISIYRNLLTGIEESLKDSSDELASIGMDAYCNDFGLIGPDGRLLNQVRCYRDERTARHADEIYSRVSAEELYSTTCAQTALFNTSMEMASMAFEGDKFLLDHAKAAMMLPDTLAYFLTGKMVTEYTMASVSQLYDYKKQEWAYDILRRLEIPENIFPDVVPTGTVIGNLKPGIVSRDPEGKIKVVAVTEHDSAAAVVAIPTEKEHVGFISSGTWSIVGTEVPEPIITHDTFEKNIAYEGGVDHRYRMIKNVMGLWIIQECLADYQVKYNKALSFDEMNQMSAEAKGHQFMIDPDDNVFYMPGDMIRKIQDYCRRTGQYVPETFGEIIRGVLESLAMKYRYTYEQIEETVGYKLTDIYIVGGGGQNLLLDQLTADACGIPVHAGPSEAALVGNIVLQMRTAGEIADLKEGRRIIAESFDIKHFEPKDKALWDDVYKQFCKLVKEGSLT
ncbi:MAG: rhamnulokinase family protein [Lachnospiraceae bacterium]|nr:rhamnulokinase family protein [Lachnospiraceae bacterium]